MLVGELRPQTVDIAATTLEREIPEHVVEGAILEHQDDDVVDLLEVGHVGLSHHRKHRRSELLSPRQPRVWPGLTLVDRQ